MISGQSDMGFHELEGDRNYLGSVRFAGFGCGCDSAVGGIIPQIRGESLVFGETEGELKRERELGCSSEDGVSIILLIFFSISAAQCHTIIDLSK